MRRLTLLLAAVLSGAILLAQGHDVVIPYVPPPQSPERLNDPVTNLSRRLASGAAKLTLDGRGGLGLLSSVLRELKIPVSSQVLVFSKTSLQFEHITPRTPRAIYFNDNVYLGFVPESDRLELSAVDPEVGAVFYTLSQRPGARPSLVTDATCLQCHQVPATLGVSGHLLRSVFVRSDGRLASELPSFLTDHRSPLAERWGGWFVSGTFSGDVHMGNALLRAGQTDGSFDRAPGTGIANVATLFYSDLYLSPWSDVVALMVLDHQARMHNLIAKLHHDAVAGTPQRDATGFPKVLNEDIEELLRYMLFVDEAPLKGPVAGPTKFAAEFERLGASDPQGRSLRQFDLRTRLFRYPCSYLIYSDAFLALPQPVKSRIYARLSDILSGRDATGPFGKLVSADRVAIASILTATHPEFGRAKSPS